MSRHVGPNLELLSTSMTAVHFRSLDSLGENEVMFSAASVLLVVG